MGKSKGKTKPFIDKKRSTTYTVLPKTQVELALLRDEHDHGADDDNHERQGRHDDEGHGNVTSSSSFHEWKNRLKQAGIALSDDELAHRYLKEVKGDGVFVDATSGRTTTSHAGNNNDPRSRRPVPPQQPTTTASEWTLDPDDPNAELLFDNVVNLTLDCMDDDMRKILMLEDLGEEHIDEEDFELGSLSVEELDDDFCLQASQEPEPEASSNPFDYDAHIRQLLERARKERDDDDEGDNENDQGKHHPGRADRDYFANSRARGDKHRKMRGGDDQDSFDDEDDMGDDDSSSSSRNGEYESDEDNVDDWMNQPQAQEKHSRGDGGGVASRLNPDEERALCDKFLETLAEYEDSDDDEVGDDDEPRGGDGDASESNIVDDYEDGESLDEGDQGGLGEAELEAAMEDFLKENEDEILVQARRDRSDANAPKNETGGSGYSVLVGTRMVPASTWNQVAADDGLAEDPPESVADVLAEADETLAAPIEILTLESVITVDEFDGRSYFSERTKNPWDCESILSTYSNLDNNPALIDHTAHRQSTRRRKNTIHINDSAPKILLSSKTGLPIRPSQIAEEDVLEATSQGASTVGVNRGAARNRNETKEEKRARKAATRQERQASQARKKELRDAFGHELQKRAVVATTDCPVGSAVFRYS